jgi:hypothetical protein
VRGIVIAHILGGRQEGRPIEVIVVLEFCDFQKALAFGDGGYDEVELLEFFFAEIGEFVQPFREFGVELFVVEDDVVVGLVEEKFAVSLLFGRVLSRIILQIIAVLIGASPCWQPECGEEDNEEAEG